MPVPTLPADDAFPFVRRELLAVRRAERQYDYSSPPGIACLKELHFTDKPGVDYLVAIARSNDRVSDHHVSLQIAAARQAERSRPLEVAVIAARSAVEAARNFWDATEKAAAGMVAGTHGSTYGGNPLACAVGAKVMEIIATPAFLSEVNRKAALFRQKLEALVAAHPAIFESVRGQGLILGLKCKVAPADFVKAGYGEHVLTVPAADNVVRLLPPLTLTDDDIAEAATRLDRAASALERTL